MKTLSRLLLVCLLLWAVFPSAALADGKTWRSGRDDSQFRSVAEEEQTAAILHEDGRELMVIAVGVDLARDEGALWLFPVPGPPEAVQLDVQDAFPAFSGHDIRYGGGQTVDAIVALAQLTQIYPVLYYMTGLGGLASAAESHAEINKWGIHTETVTADSPEALAAHLAGRGASVAKEELAAFQPYMADGWTLVATWIASYAEVAEEFPDFAGGRARLGQRRPCVSVSFPTQRAFYPMRPTASYGHTIVPLHLWVAGHVRADTATQLAELLRARYYTQDEYEAGGAFDTVTDYTRFDCYAPAGEFTEDLFFVPHVPFGVRYARALAGIRPVSPLGLLSAAAIAAVVSCFAAGFAGRVGYGSWRPYVWFGFANLLTVIGLFFVVLLCLRDSDGKRPRDWLTYVMVVSFSFVLMTVIVGALLKLPTYL